MYECKYKSIFYLYDLKADSKSVVRELLKSAHRVVMITGDSAYTAANVGDKLGIHIHIYVYKCIYMNLKCLFS
jgi:magnesium-transporting ATPase (P-type)